MSASGFEVGGRKTRNAFLPRSSAGRRPKGATCRLGSHQTADPQCVRTRENRDGIGNCNSKFAEVPVRAASSGRLSEEASAARTTNLSSADAYPEERISAGGLARKPVEPRGRSIVAIFPETKLYSASTFSLGLDEFLVKAIALSETSELVAWGCRRLASRCERTPQTRNEPSEMSGFSASPFSPPCLAFGEENFHS